MLKILGSDQGSILKNLFGNLLRFRSVMRKDNFRTLCNYLTEKSAFIEIFKMRNYHDYILFYSD